MDKSLTLKEVQEQFGTEEQCLDYLTKRRFKEGLFCPHCDNKHIYIFSDNRTYKCSSCKKKFNVKTKTIYQASKIPLTSWFLAEYYVMIDKNKITSVELAKRLGITQKTSWFMIQRIKEDYKIRQVE